MPIIRQDNLFDMQELFEMEPTQRFTAIFSTLELGPLLRIFDKKTYRGAPRELNYGAMIYSLVARVVERIPTVKLLVERLEKDPFFRLFEQIGEYLGVGANNIINTFNPQQVIIGNRTATAKQWLEKPLTDHVSNQALWFQQHDLQITFSELNTLSTALGVAAFSIENFLSVCLQPKMTMRYLK